MDPELKSELKSERITAMMTPSEVLAVDDWSFRNRVRGRAEAIRQLIKLGLETSASKASTT